MSQYLPDIVSLALTDYHLQRIAQGDQPSLAANRAHFSDVIHVHDGVSVDSLKGGLAEPFPNHPQRMGR